MPGTPFRCQKGWCRACFGGAAFRVFQLHAGVRWGLCSGWVGGQADRAVGRGDDGAVLPYPNPLSQMEPGSVSESKKAPHCGDGAFFGPVFFVK